MRFPFPTLNRPALVALLVAAALAADSGEAMADFYRCRENGREWVTNQIPKGKKRQCRLIMKTGGPKPAEVGEGAAQPPSSSGARSRYAVKPHKPRARTGPAKLPSEHLWRIILEAAERYHLPPAFVLAVIRVESNFHPRAVSRVGAQGLMQLMPATARSLGVTDAFDPRQNIMGGCKYLRMLANRFDGDLPRTIAGYHAGGGAVDRKEGVPYAATEQYVRWVLDRYYEYKAVLATGTLH